MKKNASILFKECFQYKYIEKIYFENIKYKASPGIDRVNKSVFEKHFQENINIILKKVKDGRYEFTPYKEKLILKGKGKSPREISIPTIRDKIVLRILNEILYKTFKEHLSFDIIQIKIKQIIDKIDNFKYCMKFDIKDFYPSIDHKLLFIKIRKRIRQKTVLDLLDKALKTSTVPIGQKTSIKNKLGLPQGLPISNILSEIYLLDFDNKHKNNGYSYTRYVDDILILTNEKENNIKDEVISDLNKIYLKTNNNKYSEKPLRNSFDYLGYNISSSSISVRTSSIEKIKSSIINLFSQNKYSNHSNKDQLFEWCLNLRITGCELSNRKYGWLFFFSQIDDMKLLYNLDWFVDKMFNRFKLKKSEYKIKKFVRTYHEIRKKLSKTNYIPIFSRYDLNQKLSMLSTVFDLDYKGKPESVVDDTFNKLIYKQIKEMEEDMQDFTDNTVYWY